MALYVFDAYGTLFNVHAAAERQKDAIGPKWRELSILWRAKHLEYTWVYSLAGKQAMFWMLAQRALDVAITEVGGGISTDVRSRLLASYRTMDPYPEVGEVLSTLKARGDRLAILSNGDADMLNDAVRAAKLDKTFDAVISVVHAGIFKPAPRVYEVGLAKLGAAPAEVSFQSSNRWDVAGAKAFGLRTVWVNRLGAPDEYPDLRPDRTVRDLRALLEA
jgi:2-haloacid dehalogenase